MFAFTRVSHSLIPLTLIFAILVLSARSAGARNAARMFLGALGLRTQPYGKGFIFESVYKHLFEVDLGIVSNRTIAPLNCSRFESAHKLRARRSTTVETNLACPDPDFTYLETDHLSQEEESYWLALPEMPDCLDRVSSRCLLRELRTPQFSLKWHKRFNSTDRRSYVERSFEIFPVARGNATYKIIQYLRPNEEFKLVQCLGNPFFGRVQPDEFYSFVANQAENLLLKTEILPFGVQKTYGASNYSILSQKAAPKPADVQVPSPYPNPMPFFLTKISIDLFVKRNESWRSLKLAEKQLNAMIEWPDKDYTEEFFAKRDIEAAGVCLRWYSELATFNDLESRTATEVQIDFCQTDMKDPRLNTLGMPRENIVKLFAHCFEKYPVIEVKTPEILKNWCFNTAIRSIHRQSDQRIQLVKQTAELLEMIRNQNQKNNRILFSSKLSPNLTNLELIELSRSNELDMKRLESNVTALKLEVLRLNDIKQSQSKTANSLLAQLRQSEKTTSNCRLELDAKLGKLVALEEEAERLRIRSQIRDLGKTLNTTTAEEEHLIKQILIQMESENELKLRSQALLQRYIALIELRLMQGENAWRAKLLKRERILEKREAATSAESAAELEKVFQVCQSINEELKPLTAFIEASGQRASEILTRKKRAFWIPLMVAGSVGYTFFNAFQLEKNQARMQQAENDIKKMYDNRVKDLENLVGLTNSFEDGMLVMRQSIQNLETYARNTKHMFDLVEDQIVALNDKVQTKQHWVVLLSDLEVTHRRILHHLVRSDYQKELQEGIDKLNQGFLPREMIPESELLTLINRLKAKQSDSLELAFGEKTVDNYYRLPLAQYTRVGSKLLIELSMPLIRKTIENREVLLSQIQTQPTKTCLSANNTDCDPHSAYQIELADDLLLLALNGSIVGSDRLRNWECLGQFENHVCWKIERDHLFVMDECLDYILDTKGTDSSWCVTKKRQWKNAHPVILSDTEQIETFVANGTAYSRIELRDLEQNVTDWVPVAEIVGNKTISKITFQDYVYNISDQFDKWYTNHQNHKNRTLKLLSEARDEAQTLAHRLNAIARYFGEKVQILATLLVILCLVRTNTLIGAGAIVINVNPTRVLAAELKNPFTLNNIFSETLDLVVDMCTTLIIAAAIAYYLYRVSLRDIDVQTFHGWVSRNDKGRWWIHAVCVIKKQGWVTERISFVNFYYPVRDYEEAAMLGMINAQSLFVSAPPGGAIQLADPIELVLPENRAREVRFIVQADKLNWTHQNAILDFKPLIAATASLRLLRL